MDSSIQIQEIGCCKFMNYGNYILGKYYLRTMRNGKQDIEFNGILIGAKGINPYNFIKGCSLADFEKSIIRVDECIVNLYKAISETIFQTLYTLVHAQIQVGIKSDVISEHCSYVSMGADATITMGKNKIAGAEFYETIYFQNRDSQIVLKIREHDPFGSPKFHDDGSIVFISTSIYDGVKEAIKEQMNNWMKRL